LVGVDLSTGNGRYTTPASRRSVVLRPYLQRGGDSSFFRQLLTSSIDRGAGLVPASGPFEVGGITHLRRDDGATLPGGPRLHVTQRLGDLDTTGTSPSGIVVEWPLFPDVSAGSIAGKTLRVVRRETQWRLAEEIGTDPATSLSAGMPVLPRVPHGDDYRDYYEERYVWSDIPRALGDDLQSGIGERAAVVVTPSGTVLVRLFIDRDGVYQVFLE
jgi:hypothetical protein